MQEQGDEMKRGTLLLLLLLIQVLSAYAQWEPTNGPYGAGRQLYGNDVGYVAATMIRGGDLYAVVNVRIYRSTDNGVTWK
jgi:hypothetical protein